MMTGVKMLHVPYRGETPALTDLVAGQVHVVFAQYDRLVGTRPRRAVAR